MASYTSQQYLVADASTLTNYKAWGSAISAFILASGWTRTADSGQVDWTTVASVPAIASADYEMFEPADALQTGGTKFYLKVQYAKGTGSPEAPWISFNLGTGTDGSGGLTGFVTSFDSAVQSSLTSPSASATYECDFSGDIDRLCFLMWRNSGCNATFAVVIERTKDVNGDNSSEGVTLVAFDSGASLSTAAQQTIAFGLGLGPRSAGRNYITIWNGVSGSSAFANNIPMSPVFPEAGVYGNPLIGCGFVHSEDIAEGTFFQTTLYGDVRTYIASGATAFNFLNPSSSMRLCIRYD